MLTSLGFILILGLFFGFVFKKLNLPSLLGYLVVGIIAGPNFLNFIDDNILLISSDIRQIALIIILIRAGLALDIYDLKKIGRPALLLSFVPACVEIATITFIGPLILGLSYVDSALLGCVIAAVSPAVIVPRMLNLIKEGYGKKHSVPQLVMASASVDDVFVIVLFYSFLSISKGGKFSIEKIISIPFSILLGIFAGFILGYILCLLFKKSHIRDTSKVVIVLSISFLMLPFSGLIGVMALGASILWKNQILADNLSSKFSKLWVGAEIILFILVGANVNIKYAFTLGFVGILILCIGLLMRMIGVMISLSGTEFEKREKLFCCISFIPKATVQAAIGSIPLSLGLPCGEIILTISVISILFTAPLGAILIDKNYKKLLQP